MLELQSHVLGRLVNLKSLRVKQEPHRRKRSGEGDLIKGMSLRPSPTLRTLSGKVVPKQPRS